jgi:hypothetical protein
MRALRKLNPGQKGTKKFLARYNEKLVCVRYRYDTVQRKRFTTVELIVEEASWVPPEKPTLVGLRVERQETDLQRRIKQAGGKWNPVQRVWELHYDQVVSLGLKARMVKLEVSDSKHPQVANTRHY